MNDQTSALTHTHSHTNPNPNPNIPIFAKSEKYMYFGNYMDFGQ
jgi:hypothetical protein